MKVISSLIKQAVFVLTAVCCNLRPLCARDDATLVNITTLVTTASDISGTFGAAADAYAKLGDTAKYAQVFPESLYYGANNVVSGTTPPSATYTYKLSDRDTYSGYGLINNLDFNDENGSAGLGTAPSMWSNSAVSAYADGTTQVSESWKSIRGNATATATSYYTATLNTASGLYINVGAGYVDEEARDLLLREGAGKGSTCTDNLTEENDGEVNLGVISAMKMSLSEQTTTALQAPTLYDTSTDTYAAWYVDLDSIGSESVSGTSGGAAGEVDRVRNFEIASQYSVLKADRYGNDTATDLESEVQGRSEPSTTPMISFASASSTAEDITPGIAQPVDIVLDISNGGFSAATDITITVDATIGTITDGDYILAIKTALLEPPETVTHASAGTLSGSGSPYVLTVPPDVMTITLEFTANDANDVNESVTLTLSSETSSNIGSISVHTVAITEDVLPDNHGDTQASATDITVGTSVAGSLFAGDVDYFKVEVSAASILEVYTEGDADTYGDLEDTDGNVLDSNDDATSGDGNFRMISAVDAGTYYIRVGGYVSSESYTLFLRFFDNVAPSFDNASFTILSSTSRVGSVEASDSDGSIVSYAVVSQTQTVGGSGSVEKFEIDNHGLITVKEGATLAVGDTYELSIATTDDLGGTTTATVTIEVKGTVPLGRLIAVDNPDKLAAIRYDLDGDGIVDNTSDEAAYAAAFGTLTAPADGWSGYKLMANLNFSGTKWASDCPSGECLEADGTSDGTSATVGWRPIGHYVSSLESAPFTATFDGNGYEISNLYINRPTAESTALFGFLSGSLAEIRNVELRDVDVSGEGRVGGLIGNNEGGTVRDSYVTGAVSGNEADSGDNYIGGLIGRHEEGTVSGSYATCSVAGLGYYVGGLVGGCFEGVIAESYATGSVSGDDDLGGLVGWNDYGSVVVACYSTAAVTGSSEDFARVGGLVGLNYGKISMCYATGDVETSTEGDVGTSTEGDVGTSTEIESVGSFIGGLVGLSDGGTISACYAIGSVVGSSGSHTGGLLGRNDGGTISACYATGNVRGGRDYTGGLVGYSDGTINACYSIGNVRGDGTIIGGLLGYNNGGTLRNSYFDTTFNASLMAIGRSVSPTGETNVSGKGSSDLQTPTDYGTSPDIYSTWNVDVDNMQVVGVDNAMTAGDADVDDPWNFGTSSQYPVLQVDFNRDGTATAAEFGSQRFLRSLFDSYSFTVLNTATTGTVDTVYAIPSDYSHTLTYSITSQTLNGSSVEAFVITDVEEGNGNVGVISISSPAPTLTIGEEYILQVQLSDGVGGTSTTSVSIEVLELTYTMHNGEVTSCKGRFLDSGGDGNYDNEENLVMTIAPEVATDRVRVEFTEFDLEKYSHDYLEIYNGASPDVDFLIYEYTGVDLPPAAVSSSSDGKLTFRFVSDRTVTYAGWVATISCVTPPSAVAGLSVDAVTETSATLSWASYTEDNTGFRVYYHVISGFDPLGHQGEEVMPRPAADAMGVTVSNLTPGTTYYFRVAAVNGDEIGHYTEVTATLTSSTNYDTDNDNLIEVRTLAQLNAIRYDLDGDGVPTFSGLLAYSAAFGVTASCASDCKGYELMNNLDFDDADGSAGSGTAPSVWSDPSAAAPADGATRVSGGWLPIGNGPTIRNQFRSVFEGNGNVISNLYINRDTQHIGLFGYVSSGGLVRNLALEGVAVTSSYALSTATTAALAGRNNGTISACYAAGNVIGGLRSDAATGGLVGDNSGAISGCYSEGLVIRGESAFIYAYTGGLVGDNSGTISACYATGYVTVASGLSTRTGGLVGRNDGGTISACYSIGSVTVDLGYFPKTGGLVGYNSSGTLRNSYFNSSANSSLSAIGDDFGIATNVSAKTATELQTPTMYDDNGDATDGTSIYENWNIDLDNMQVVGVDNAMTAGDADVDDPWDFGTSGQYPALQVDFNRDGTATVAEFGSQRFFHSLTDSYSFTVFDTATTGTVVGTVYAIPSDYNHTLTYSITSQTLNGSSVEAFAITDVAEGNVNVGVISVSSPAPTLTIGEEYILQVQVSDGVGGTSTTSVSIEVLETIYIMHNGEITSCKGRFLDSGGDGNYDNDVNLLMTISPEVATDRVRVEFTEFDLEKHLYDYYDYLEIYNGASPDMDFLIDKYKGGDLPPATVSNSPDGKLTFHFVSDVSRTYAGWVAKISCVTPPSAVVGLSVDAVTERSATLSWASYTEDNTGFRVYYHVTSNFDPLGYQGAEVMPRPAADATAVTVSNLMLGTTYYFRVAAENNGVLSEYSSPLTVTTLPSAPSVSSVPASLTAAAVSSEQIDLTWTPPLTDGGVAITGYRLQFSRSGASGPFTDLPISGTTLSYQHNGLDPGTTYYYQVAALNNVGTGAYLSMSAITDAATLSLSATSLSFASEESTETIDITSNTSWTATSSAPGWLTISGSPGVGDGQISLTASAQLASAARSATVTVSGGGLREMVSVSQAGSTTTLSLSATSLSFASEESTETIDITSNTSWTATSSAPGWLTISGSPGVGDGQISLTASAQLASAARSATVTVSGGGLREMVSVSQAGSTTTLSLSATSLSFASEESTETIDITSNTSWTATSSAPGWLTISGSPGVGDGQISLTASAQLASAARSATVTVSGGGLREMVSVSQAGSATTLSLSATSLSFASEESTETIDITSNTSWTATSSAPGWLTISGSPGVGDGQISLTASAQLASAARSATVTVSGGGLREMVSVSQAGSTTTLSLSATSLSFASEESTETIDITSNTSWTATSSAPGWLTISGSPGVGDGQISLTASAQLASAARSAIVTVSGGGLREMVSVSQAGSTTTLSLSATSLSFASEESTETIDITSNTSWTATSSAPGWLTISGSPGVGDGQISLTALAQLASTARSATVTVSGGGLREIVSVSQAGSATTLSLSATSLSFASEESTETIDITSNTSWTATSSAPGWLTISGSPGVGDGQISLTASAQLASAARSATVTVSGGGLREMVSVSQVAAIVPRNLTATVISDTQVDLAWQAPSSTSGIEITGYQLQVSIGEGTTFIDLHKTTGLTLTYAHKGLIAGTTYYYRVAVISSRGTGIYSSIVSATTTANTATLRALELDKTLRLYPNPSSGEVRFIGLSATQRYAYKVYSLLGEELLSGRLYGGEIDISSLRNGQYILILQAHDEEMRTQVLLLK